VVVVEEEDIKEGREGRQEGRKETRKKDDGEDSNDAYVVSVVVIMMGNDG
jgi:hypothetical protein